MCILTVLTFILLVNFVISKSELQSDERNIDILSTRKNSLSLQGSIKGVFTLINSLPGVQSRLNKIATIKMSFYDVLKSGGLKLKKLPTVDLAEMDPTGLVAATIAFDVDFCSDVKIQQLCTDYYIGKCTDAKKILGKAKKAYQALFQQAVIKALEHVRHMPINAEEIILSFGPSSDHVDGFANAQLANYELTNPLDKRVKLADAKTVSTYYNCNINNPSLCSCAKDTCTANDQVIKVTLPSNIYNVSFLMYGTNCWNGNKVQNVLTGFFTFKNPGVTFHLFIGSCGINAQNGYLNYPKGGWNGGGDGNLNLNNNPFQTGGDGGTDIRLTSDLTDWSSRVVVAGGGGGIGSNAVTTYYGGIGGNFSGTDGNAVVGQNGCQGRGATQTSFGKGGVDTYNGSPGTFGVGGAGTQTNQNESGGGGGGFYGGGGGAGWNKNNGCAGGGGSSGYATKTNELKAVFNSDQFYNSVQTVTVTDVYRVTTPLSGYGYIQISY